MAAKRVSTVRLRRYPRGFMTILTSAVCEWVLIFFLMLNAILSYLLTRFAQYCDLELPCLLCSRLGHVLGNEKPDFYRNLLCDNHRLELSSLICCHTHGNKLADANEMCEDCIYSSAAKNKSLSESNTVLMAKLGLNDDGHHFQDVNRKDSGRGSVKYCSCCCRPWRSRQNAQRLLQLKPTGVIGGKSKPDVPLPRSAGHGLLEQRGNLKKMRERYSGMVVPLLGNIGVDSLSHIGYSELKITSDSESEFPFSDDDDGSSLSRGEHDDTGKFSAQSDSETLSKTHLAPAKLKNAEPSLIDLQHDVPEPRDVKCLESDKTIGHGLEELNWQQAEKKSTSLVTLELASLDHMPPAEDTPPISHAVKVPDVEISSEKVITESIETEDKLADALATEPQGDLKSEEATTAGDNRLNKPAQVVERYLNPNNEPKLAIRSEGSEESSLHDEQPVTKNFSTSNNYVEKDPNRILSEKTSEQVIASSTINTSSQMQVRGDEVKLNEPSSVSGMQVLRKLASIERQDSGISVDGSIVSEIEGESPLDRLKRQAEYDRKCIGALTKELDEERSAAAIAANQAMAMITRLQEEKASLHMEALQYLRMMEEQAEYDVEALQKANDLLAEKEKEVQDLEAELEFYRNEYPQNPIVEPTSRQTSDVKAENNWIDNSSSGFNENNVDITLQSGEAHTIQTNVFLEFEDEKLYIARCLKKLEKRFNRFLSNGDFRDMPNGHYSKEIADGVKTKEEFANGGGGLRNHEMDEDNLEKQEDPPLQNGSLPDNPSAAESHPVSKQNNHLDSDGESSIQDRQIDLVAIENEALDLHDRLEALEVDCELVEHTFNALQNGDEGMQYIQEIIHHLQELRQIWTRKRCLSDP
ncbi:GTD-binding domain [Dillenia turbinata]|uniref:GTD-binding domain n=1 Tax=Dillenia turbinata TaxID=194707 RepID=A0AAN8VUX0_9MAGN